MKVLRCSCNLPIENRVSIRHIYWFHESDEFQNIQFHLQKFHIVPPNRIIYRPQKLISILFDEHAFLTSRSQTYDPFKSPYLCLWKCFLSKIPTPVFVSRFRHHGVGFSLFNCRIFRVLVFLCFVSEFFRHHSPAAFMLCKVACCRLLDPALNMRKFQRPSFPSNLFVFNQHLHNSSLKSSTPFHRISFLVYRLK